MAQHGEKEAHKCRVLAPFLCLSGIQNGSLIGALCSLCLLNVIWALHDSCKMVMYLDKASCYRDSTPRW